MSIRQEFPAVDPQSPTWQAVSRRLISEIDAATETLIGKDREDPSCDKLRGRIRLAQEVLSWADTRE